MPDKTICIEDNFFNAKECEGLINYCKGHLTPGKLDTDENPNNNIRRSNIFMITNALQEADLFYKINKKIWEINQQYFRYDIQMLNFLQFTEYSESYSGKYEVHTDCFDSTDSDGIEWSRKLSFTIQLSEPSDYEGGELCFPDNDAYNPESVKARGTLISFGSFNPHGVTPVTKGNRYSLVGWVLGPRWR